MRPADRSRDISGSPRFRKKCWWKHTRKKMWVECPFRKKVGQVRTLAADSWHRGTTVKCWWQHTRKTWAYAAYGWPGGVPLVVGGQCVPPSGSKQEGRICEDGTLCWVRNGCFTPDSGKKHMLIGQLCFGLFKADLNSIQGPAPQTGSLYPGAR